MVNPLEIWYNQQIISMIIKYNQCNKSNYNVLIFLDSVIVIINCWETFNHCNQRGGTKKWLKDND